MRFDFTTIPDRHNHDAIAIDGLGDGTGFAPAAPKEGFDSIPLWVADMSFATAPSVTRAIHERVDHPFFGYYSETDAYYQAIIDWHQNQKGVSDLAKEHIGYENGVLGGVVSALNILCSKGDNVLVHSPTYVGFTGCCTNNGYNLVHSPLVLDDAGVWRMDFEDMERKIVDNHIHAAIFCSPHNPCGRVWERWELEQAMALFEKHGVFVVSDEIWSDLLLNGNVHIPTQQVSDWAHDHTIALYAPSKTFNLAGLIGSYHVIYDQWLRDRVCKESSLGHYNSQNVLSMHGLIGAYSEEGAAWTKELCQVLSDNVNYACEKLASYEGVTCAKAEGTYVLLADCRTWCDARGISYADFPHLGWDVGVTWHDGRLFECPGFVRIAVSVPHAQVVEAFDRLDRYVFGT
ncbi:MAG: aminotransferase class I/II-fold pyridoxal phosphate-dependent enzyme [Atopobiaceae bacterium]|nr:aminotransferase class I/II-fold pyridoxal phosphate-dependent enzyme [Atopobiaceae bacterium]